MSTNKLLQNPPLVVVFDPIKNINLRTFCFLGDVPKAVFNACNYYRTVSTGQRSAYDKLLKEYYGTDYKTKLGLGITDYTSSYLFSNITGGNDDNDLFSHELKSAQQFIEQPAQRDYYTENGSFTHLGKRYDIHCAFTLIANKKAGEIPVTEIDWILNEMPKDYFNDPTEAERVTNADLTAPVMLTVHDHLTYILDGIHRLKKAIDSGQSTMPAKFISNEELDHCDISNEVVGIKAILGGDVDDDEFEDIERLLNVPAETTPDAAKKMLRTADENLTADFTPGIEYITDVQIFPDDKYSEIKEKLYLVTKIPAYRQHMFFLYQNRIQNMHTIHAEGIYTIDIRNLVNFKDKVHGIPVDKHLYDLRESMHIEAFDMFTVIGDTQPNGNIIYVTDLAQFTYPARTQMLDLISDTYQFDLFYYGFIVKYWPQLTKLCFYDYITNEPELQHKYPDLAKNRLALSNIYRTEKEIITTHYKQMNKALSFAGHSGLSIAITQMIATVTTGRTIINIRNLFDKLRVSKCIPEIHAYVEHENRKYMLRKRHIRNKSDIIFPTGALMKTGITMAISLRKMDQESFHHKSAVSTFESEQSRYLFLNIWSNGRYYIKTQWDEEDELDFNAVIKIMKKFTDHIINGINKLDKYVFVAGKSLPLISKQNINYQSLNIHIFWKKVMLGNTFKIIKSMWDPYMRARMTGIRNVQQFDKYEFMFRKGMYEFDNSLIDRIMTISNHYAYLSDNTIKQKWDQHYDGRIVRMSHRTTDIRFEVNDIREKEFQSFYAYIVSFVYKAAHDNQVQSSMKVSKTYIDVKKLRKLREQDPELFNLKKYGSKKVYSRICQNKQQPFIYTPDEIKGISAKDIKSLTQYWNFTLNKPAYYGCPNKKYPHLSFIVGVHPKHYCLPCCNKKQPIGDENRKMRINEICMKNKKYIETDAQKADEDGISRHVIGYGKDIDIGRLAKLPHASIKNLLFDTIHDVKLNYYIYGVAQHVPAVENVGIIYATAEALDMSTGELMNKLLKELSIERKTPLFNIFLNGSIIEYFQSIDDLIMTIKETFVDLKMVTKEQTRFNQWPELFMEMFYLIFDVVIFTFIDEDGSGMSVDLFVPNFLHDEVLNTPNDIPDKTYLMTIKSQNRYYPIFAIDVDKYFKVNEIAMKKFNNGQKVVRLMFDIVLHGSNVGPDANKIIDLTLMQAFVAGNQYKIARKLINKHNLCYGVIVETKQGIVYVPIDYSAYSADDIEISFAAFSRDEYTLSYDALNKFIGQMNDYIKNNYGLIGVKDSYLYKQLIVKNFTQLGTEIIGLTTECGLSFYFDPNSAIPNDIPVKNTLVDFTKVNAMIMARAEPITDNRAKLLGAALYNNYAYQLFIIEFVNYLSNDRNTELRDQIIALVRETNFKKDTGEFRRHVRELLKSYPEDRNVIQSQITAFYKSCFDKNLLLQQINDYTYEFDKVTARRLKKLPKDKLKIELKRISDAFAVQKDFDSTNIQFPNIYMPCSILSNGTGYCDQHKLMINQSIDDFIDLLATDLLDDLKSKYLIDGIFMDTTLDYFSFERFPSEQISIYKITE